MLSAAYAASAGAAATALYIASLSGCHHLYVSRTRCPPGEANAWYTVVYALGRSCRGAGVCSPLLLLLAAVFVVEAAAIPKILCTCWSSSSSGTYSMPSPSTVVRGSFDELLCLLRHTSFSPYRR